MAGTNFITSKSVHRVVITVTAFLVASFVGAGKGNFFGVVPFLVKVVKKCIVTLFVNLISFRPMLSTG